MSVLIEPALAAAARVADPAAAPVEAPVVRPPAGRWRVVLMVPARDEGAAALVNAVRAHIHDLPVDFDTADVEPLDAGFPDQLARAGDLASERRADLVIWFDARAGKRLFLFLAEPKGGRTLVRDVGRQQDMHADAQALALVVRGVVGALVQGGRIGVEVAGPPTPVAPPPAEPPRAPVLMHAGYAAEAFASDAPLHQGLAVGVEVRLSAGVSGLLRYRVLFASSAFPGGLADLELGRHPIDLGFVGIWRGPRLSFAAGLVAIVDPMSRRVKSVAAGLSPEPERLSVLFGAGVFLRGALRLADRIQIFVEGGADGYLNGVRFVVGVEGVDRTVLTPWRVRPRTLAGFAIDL